MEAGGRRARRDRGAPTLILAALLTLGASAPGAETLDPRLKYLAHLRAALGTGAPGDPTRGGAHTAADVAARLERAGARAAAAAVRIAASDPLAGSIRFRHEPSRDDLRELAELGARFSDFGVGPAGSRTVYPARIPWAALAGVAAHPAVLWIAPGWRVAPQPPLAVSRPQVQAEDAWRIEDLQGRPLAGRGRLVADFDTGIQYYHPAFFFADGDTLAWIDADGSGDLTAGDAVDLNGNHGADPGEALRCFEAQGADHYGNTPGVYNPSFDWLYNDANGNLSRDYGPQFGETQPGYGEPLFLALDADGDDRLDPEERLAMLGTSKVRAVRGRDGFVGERGVDLLQAEVDTWGHGTGVSGILCGGWRGIHRLSGIAPECELLHAVNDYTNEPPFLVPMEEHLAWAASHHPDVFLIEDGEWIWEYLDGSSNVETMLDEYAAREGILPVVPAGNLATGLMHTCFTAPGPAGFRGSSAARVIWADLLWRAAESPAVTLFVPGGASGVLALGGTTQAIGAYEVYSLQSVSPRGTRRIDVRIEHAVPGTPLTGFYRFELAPPGGASFEVHGFIIDDVSGWLTASYWDFVDPRFTVTWPATADSAVSIAAYDPAGDGDINAFSGWGPRIDGRPAVDIAAPGSTVYSTYHLGQGGFTAFGGTSAAGPHAAGAAALLRQLWPQIDCGFFRHALRAGAGTDAYTTDPHRWGAGKLRILDALSAYAAGVAPGTGDATPAAGGTAPADHGEAAGARPGAGSLALALHPCPSTGAVRLTLQAQGPDPIEVRIRDLAGRLVLARTIGAAGIGPVELRWDGCDDTGRPAPSGIYLVHAVQGRQAARARVLRLR